MVYTMIRDEFGWKLRIGFAQSTVYCAVRLSESVDDSTVSTRTTKKLSKLKMIYPSYMCKQNLKCNYKYYRFEITQV
jgi:hypothetical protein